MPKFSSMDNIIEYFDNNDLGDYLDNLRETNFDVNISKKTHYFALEEDIASRITDIANSKHVPSEALINSWIREKVSNL